MPAHRKAVTPCFQGDQALYQQLSIVTVPFLCDYCKDSPTGIPRVEPRYTSDRLCASEDIAGCRCGRGSTTQPLRGSSRPREMHLHPFPFNYRWFCYDFPFCSSLRSSSDPTLFPASNPSAPTIAPRGIVAGAAQPPVAIPIPAPILAPIAAPAAAPPAVPTNSFFLFFFMSCLLFLSLPKKRPRRGLTYRTELPRSGWRRISPHEKFRYFFFRPEPDLRPDFG